MLKVENICKNISDYLEKELKLNNNSKEIINYGLFALIQMGISIFLVLIVGFIFDVALEAVTISLVISILRKSSGGVHVSSPASCSIIGALISILSAIIIKIYKINITSIIVIGIIIFLSSYYILYKKAPIDSKAKPIKTIQKRNRLKKSSLITLTIFLSIVLVNLFIYIKIQNYSILTYSMCIYLGIIWQVFSLTNYGQFVFKILDKIVSKLIFWR